MISVTRRIIFSLQLFFTAAIIGIGLFVYNDWRVHRTLAEPLSPTPTELQPSPNTSSDEGEPGVSGTIQVNPDGSMKQL
jgi:hypothetical protein